MSKTTYANDKHFFSKDFKSKQPIKITTNVTGKNINGNITYNRGNKTSMHSIDSKISNSNVSNFLNSFNQSISHSKHNMINRQNKEVTNNNPKMLNNFISSYNCIMNNYSTKGTIKNNNSNNTYAYTSLIKVKQNENLPISSKSKEKDIVLNKEKEGLKKNNKSLSLINIKQKYRDLLKVNILNKANSNTLLNISKQKTRTQSEYDNNAHIKVNQTLNNKHQPNLSQTQINHINTTNTHNNDNDNEILNKSKTKQNVIKISKINLKNKNECLLTLLKNLKDSKGHISKSKEKNETQTISSYNNYNKPATLTTNTLQGIINNDTKFKKEKIDQNKSNTFISIKNNLLPNQTKQTKASNIIIKPIKSNEKPISHLIEKEKVDKSEEILINCNVTNEEKPNDQDNIYSICKKLNLRNNLVDTLGIYETFDETPSKKSDNIYNQFKVKIDEIRSSSVVIPNKNNMSNYKL